MSNLCRAKSISTLAAFILLGSSSGLCQEITEPPAPSSSSAPIEESVGKSATEIELEAVWQDGPSARLQLKNSEDSSALEKLLFDIKYQGEESESGLFIDGTIDGSLKQLSFYNKYQLGDKVRTLTEWKRELDSNSLRGEFLASLLGNEEWSVCHKLRQDEAFNFKTERTEISVAVPAFAGGIMKLSGTRAENSSEIVGEIRGQVSKQIHLGVTVSTRKSTESAESPKATEWAPAVESKLRWAW